MTAVLFFLEALFCLKIGWNLLTPCELAWRTLKANAYHNKGISIAPWLEFILLAFVGGALAGWIVSLIMRRRGSR